MTGPKNQGKPSGKIAGLLDADDRFPFFGSSIFPKDSSILPPLLALGCSEEKKASGGLFGEEAAQAARR